MWGFRVVVLHRKARNCSKVRAPRLYFLFPSTNMVNGWVVAGDVIDAESPSCLSPLSIGHSGKYHNTLRLYPKFCISIVFIFSWDHFKSQEKLDTMLIQNLRGQTKSVMVFSEVAFCAALALVVQKVGLCHPADKSLCIW